MPSDAEIDEALAAGDTPGAIGLLQRAVALRPRDHDARVFLASLYRENGRMRDAVMACDAVLVTNPRHAAAWLERGFVLAAGGSFDNAMESYRRAIALEPANADALAGLASILAVRGDLGGAVDLARRAMAASPGNLTAATVLARAEIEAGNTLVAAQRLAVATKEPHDPSPPLATAFNTLGDAWDKAGDTKRAFEAYTASKSVFRDLYTPRFGERPPAQRLLIEHVERGLRDARPGAWSTLPGEPGPAQTHCFLLGYPRSGTTLVENILTSAPDVVALEERPTLAQADAEFLLPENGITQLAQLDAEGAARLRAAYWGNVARAGAEVAGIAFVDMDPLKGIRLPTIARLFPRAKIVVMRRDPREVVWSCFHTNFALSSAAYDYADLTDTARHYDALMRLITLSLDVLPLDTHIVRYEALVRDFDATTQALCNFLGIEWTPTLRSFDKTAERRGVSTASATQVRRGLYDGTRQWERYAHYLEPVLPILAPWIERFGY